MSEHADATMTDEVPEYDTPDGNAPAGDTAPRQRHPFEDLPLEEDGMPSGQDLMNGLRAVVDPEIGYNIVDLGLVYEVTKPARGQAHVLMTLTSMGCPLTEVIHQQCSVILGAMPGVDNVEVEFTFTPPWSTDMIADYVREELRAMGMNV
ncbi:MAG: metal-sulfur cluster assembly factor [Nitriliruptoraceae bacterium]|nr:metal-sulfur cluster assembly factor [Nitriliruptoraceae bacterium]